MGVGCNSIGSVGKISMISVAGSPGNWVSISCRLIVAVDTIVAAAMSI